MDKLLLYYILSTLIGVAVGLFLSNFFLKKRFMVKMDLLNSNIKEKEKCLIELESECKNKKDKLDEIVMDSIICKGQLLQTSNSLRKKSDELYRLQDNLDAIKNRISNIKKIEKRNRGLLREVSKLKKIKKDIDSSNQNSMLLEEFKRLKKIIEERDKYIANISKKDKIENLYYFKISKDQFKQIEKILKEYKAKSDILEKENIKLNTLNIKKQEVNILEKINSSFFNFSDVTHTNFSKDNYEKISKA